MIHFETDKKPLLFLLDSIENRALALPDFQRSFVWDPDATRELVVSIVRSFPAGTLLQMEGGSKVFAPRAFEEAPELNGNPSHLVLDGQQRLTSLFQAFIGRGTHRYFLNIRELIDREPVDEAVEVYTAKQATRFEEIDQQAEHLMLPLSKLRYFADWKDDVLELLADGGTDVKKFKVQLNEVEREFVKPVEQYQFPVTTLSASTPPEAVCTIFETLNRTGVKLSVFELLTARAFAHEIHLRDMWAQARKTYPVLVDFGINPYYVLQTVAVLARGNPQRATVLSLDVREMVDYWDEAVRGLARSLELLRDECGVLVAKWLPYATMLITLAAVWGCVEEIAGPAIGARRSKLIRWFWCSSFAQSYENAGNSVTERDVPELRSWLRDGKAPSVVADFAFDSTRWHEIGVRQRALYRATIALLMRHSPLDFHLAVPLSKPVIDGAAVDDHHVFPRAYLKGIGRGNQIDSVLNHTLIDRTTNIRISGRAPSAYLGEMREQLGSKLDAVLSSHGLPHEDDGPLFQDDFDGFLAWRLRYLESELGEVSGGGVGQGVAGLELVGDEDVQESLPTEDVTSGADDIARLLKEFDPGPSLRYIESFIEQVAGWPAVNPWVGQGQHRAWRRIHFARRGSRLGAFAKLHPRLSRVTFRLPASELREGSAAEIQHRGPYQLRIALTSEDELADALALAKTAYEDALS